MACQLHVENELHVSYLFSHLYFFYCTIRRKANFAEVIPQSPGYIISLQVVPFFVRQPYKVSGRRKDSEAWAKPEAACIQGAY